MSDDEKKFDTASGKFHAHLDACDRCASQCFNLCETGERLLREAVAAGMPIVQQHEPMRGN